MRIRIHIRTSSTCAVALVPLYCVVEVYMYTYVCIRMYTCMLRRRGTPMLCRSGVYAYVCLYTHVYVYAYVYVYVHVYVTFEATGINVSIWYKLHRIYYILYPIECKRYRILHSLHYSTRGTQTLKEPGAHEPHAPYVVYACIRIRICIRICTRICIQTLKEPGAHEPHAPSSDGSPYPGLHVHASTDELPCGDVVPAGHAL